MYKARGHYIEVISLLPCSLLHYSQRPRYGNDLRVRGWMNRWINKLWGMCVCVCVYIVYIWLYVVFHHIYIHIYGVKYEVYPESIQPCNMKNKDIYWRRYEIQETSYIGQWCLSPLQSTYLVTSHSSPNCHQLPVIFSWISLTVWNLFPFKDDFGFGKSQKS